MALYTNKSYDDIAADYDAWQRQEKQRQEKLAQEAYTRSQYQAQKKNDNPGGLAGVLSGIVNSVKNAGKGIGDMFTNAAISAYAGTGLKSLLEGKDYMTANAEADRDKKDFEKRYWGTDDVEDAYKKSAGAALDAAATVSDFIPVAGAGVKAASAGIKGANAATKIAKVATNPAAKVALNIGQGAVSGAAQNYINNGKDATLEDSLKGALIGAAGAGAGQAVGGKLASKMPSDSLTSKLLYGSVGKGALTGAASGAVSGGVGSALYGGNVFEGATKGAGQGALGGATTGAITGAVGSVTDKIKNSKNGKTVETTQEEITNPVTLERQKAKGWGDQSLSGAAKRQNALQKLGGDLQDAAEATRDYSVYGKLKGNTADEMIKKDAINKLKANYGYSPDDYNQASKLSEAVNKWYDSEIDRSGASKVNTQLSEDLALPTNNTLPSKYEKAYRETINNALAMANAGDSDVIDSYSAGGLEKAAKYLGKQEQHMLRTNQNGVDGRVDGDRQELASYYKNARQILRNEVDSMIELDDATKKNLSKMLDDAGATEKAKKTILSAQNFAEVKSATSPLEDARTMYRQMKSSSAKRGGNSDRSTSITTQAANATGINNLVEVGSKPIRSLAAGVEDAVGKVVSKAGDIAAGSETLGKVGNAVTGTARAVNNNSLLGDNSIMTRQIARQEALDQGRQAEARAYNAAAEAEAQNARNQAEADYAQAVSNISQLQQAQSPQTAAAEKQLQTISNAMELALNAGDYTSYSKLADLYNDAYKIYGQQVEAAKTSTNPYANLSSTQIENINKLENAGSAIDELEQLFTKAGGGQGFIGGNAANFMAALGLNSNVATYNSIARGLVNQISAAIGKTDSLNTEGEVQRALELIPQMTDDAQTAKNKLEQLRKMLTNTKATAYKSYGLSQ